VWCRIPVAAIGEAALENVIRDLTAPILLVSADAGMLEKWGEPELMVDSHPQVPRRL
jgi:hypothetical protein